jgi:hypothetical protein
MDFFRHCPGCGRRFHVKLVSKSVIDAERDEGHGVIGMVGGRGLAHVVEGPTLLFDIKEFRYVYKCKHCGHEWSEVRIGEEHMESLGENTLD